LIAACCLRSSEEGRDLTFEESQAYFRDHSASLLHIIDLVEACRPSFPREGVYNAIRLHDPTGGNPTCVNGGKPRVEEIISAMRDAEILVADIRLSSQGQTDYASFALYSAGLSVSGVGVDLIYYADPRDIPPPPFVAGYEFKSLAAEPDNWFWRRWVT